MIAKADTDKTENKTLNEEIIRIKNFPSDLWMQEFNRKINHIGASTIKKCFVKTKQVNIMAEYIG